MSALVDILAKVRFQVLALALGALFVLIACFRIDDIGKLKLDQLDPPAYPVLVIGIALIIAAVTMAAVPAAGGLRGGTSFRHVNIIETVDRVSISIGRSTINIRLGRIETAVAEPSCTLVVLPANEYFDDECINDPRSALGAFVQKHYPGRTKEFRETLADRLSAMPQSPVEVEGRQLQSYGLGTAAFLDRALNESHRILVAAATTHRPGEGLRGDVVALFNIVREANRVAMDHRLREVNLPLIGAGHGSIKPTRALLVQLLAWCELLYAKPGQRLAVNIFVFRRDEAGAAEIPPAQIAQILRLAIGVCAPDDDP